MNGDMEDVVTKNVEAEVLDKHMAAMSAGGTQHSQEVPARSTSALRHRAQSAAAGSAVQHKQKRQKKQRR